MSRAAGDGTQLAEPQALLEHKPKGFKLFISPGLIISGYTKGKMTSVPSDGESVFSN